MRWGDMRKTAARVLLLAVACLAGEQLADAQQRKDGKDDVVGARWQYVITHDKKKETGVFRVYNKEIFRGARKVGNVDPHGPDRTTLIVDGLPEINGRAELRKVGQRPPIWKGTLIRPNGSKWAMEVEVRDR